ncbi:MAG: hypothetical protein EBU90_04940 [Proteobacteria bacterium]|nr:hypothetical protein [Pseudomonadota bacterium]
MKLTATKLKQIIAEEIKAAVQQKKTISEAMSPITSDEVEAWKSGDWGYVSGDQDRMMDDGDDPERFLHGEDPHDDEGSMVKSRLYSMKQMSADLCSLLNPEDQLPGWVQDHISVAHENMQQVHGYLMGKQHAVEHEMSSGDVVESKSRLNESHNRITKEEMNAWMRGDWGFNSEDSSND